MHTLKVISIICTIFYINTLDASEFPPSSDKSKGRAIVPSLAEKIKHVVVLMLENRSLDHMLGYLKQLNNDVNGCLPGLSGCSNPLNPQDPESPTVTVEDTAIYQQVSPSHSIHETTHQIYGYPDGVTPPPGALPTMDGFIASYKSTFPGDEQTDENAAGIMKVLFQL
jgi:phospholipase C